MVTTLYFAQPDFRIEAWWHQLPDDPNTLSLPGSGFGLTFTAVTGSAVPEPATWAMMLVDFAIAEIGLRKRATLEPAFA